MQLPQLQKLPPVPLICVHTDQKGLGANKTSDTYLPTAACRRVAKEEHSEGKKRVRNVEEKQRQEHSTLQYRDFFAQRNLEKPESWLTSWSRLHTSGQKVTGP